MPGGMSCGKQIGELTVCFQAVHCLEVKHLAREELVYDIPESRRQTETCVGV